LARRRGLPPRIAEPAHLQNPQEFGKRNSKAQNLYSVNSARHTFSKVLKNSGNGIAATQNPYSANLGKDATTIWSGTITFIHLL
jgi:hypothetical protein